MKDKLEKNYYCKEILNTSNDKYYDMIIIGAGLSGCVLGYLLKKQNKKVLIVENKDMKNKSKLCGGLLTEKSYNLLNEIYVNDIENLNFSLYKKNYIINNSKNIEFNNFKTYTINRKDLDDFVLKEYLKLNGKIMDNSKFSDLDIENKEININNEKHSFNYLIAADGIFSSVRKELTNRNQRKVFALENNFITEKFENLEIHFFDKLKSFGWIIPNIKCTMIGIGDVSGKIKLEEDYNSYLKQLNIKCHNKKGAFLPTGDDILLEYGDFVKFIGDAAGLISPITGEGIFYAITSAKFLSEDFINYKKSMRKNIKQIREESFYKRFVYNYKIRNFIFDRSDKKMFRGIINKFAKKIL